MENCLHVLLRQLASKDDRIGFQVVSSLFDDILQGNSSVCSAQLFCHLLQQKDENGATPLMVAIKHQKDHTMPVPELQNIMECSRSSVNIADNLGNTALHYTCMNALCAQLLEKFAAVDAEMNIQNKFGQIPVHFICSFLSYALDLKSETLERQLREVIFCLLSNGCDLNIQDKWGSNAIMNICATRPEWAKTMPMFSEWPESSTSQALNIIAAHSSLQPNIKDMFGATALHYTAAHNTFHTVRCLVANGIDTSLTDKIKDDALNTARRHMHKKTEDEILKHIGAELIYDRMQEFFGIVSGIILHQNISSNVDPDDVLHMLLHNLYCQRSKERTAVETSVRFLVTQLCLKITEYDARFQMSVHPVGSTAEGTKTGDPDEFDFILSLNKLSELCDIIEIENPKNGVLAELQFKEMPVSEEFSEFADYNGKLLPHVILKCIYRYIYRALHDISLWKNEKLFSIHPGARCIKRHQFKDVLMLNLVWMGCEYKRMPISVDLVPCVNKEGWLPSAFDRIRKEFKQTGPVVLLRNFVDNPIFGFFDEFNPIAVTSAILDRIDMKERDKVNSHETIFETSCAPMEVSVMQMLPQKVRDTYSLTKNLKHICTDAGISFSSYELKNCVFYVVEDVLLENQTDLIECLESYTIKQLTIKVFEKLLRSIKDDWCLKEFYSGRRISQHCFLRKEMTQRLEQLIYFLTR